MTSMKASLYALSAMVVGVLLIGAIPNQLSNVYSPIAFQNLERTDNNTLNGSDKKPFANVTGGSDSQLTTAYTWSINTLSKDASYYGLWFINVLIAISVYYLSKKFLI